MKRYACIGKSLKHSFSKEIHEKLADYPYELIELAQEELAPFFEKRDFAAINVTIPYKSAVLPFLDEVDEKAARIGAVNTIVCRSGRLIGYNTDYEGMTALVLRLGLSLKGKKVLILGTGGTSKTARVVAEDLGAAEILTVSRRMAADTVTYEEAGVVHADADVIFNTTPCGMYPETDKTPLDLSVFTRLSGVVDAVYNPLKTNLVLDALQRKIPAEGGLYMLVMQAVKAVELFLGKEIDCDLAERVFAQLVSSKENVVLVGMPASGKSTVGKLLNIDGFSFVDTDEEVEKRTGCTVGQLIETRGEAYFRDVESAVIQDAARECSQIISTGGGAVLREENVRALKQNGRLYFLDAPLARLAATKDRPLSNTREKLEQLYRERHGIYQSCADVTVSEFSAPQDAADYILQKRTERGQ